MRKCLEIARTRNQEAALHRLFVLSHPILTEPLILLTHGLDFRSHIATGPVTPVELRWMQYCSLLIFKAVCKILLADFLMGNHKFLLGEGEGRQSVEAGSKNIDAGA